MSVNPAAPAEAVPPDLLADLQSAGYYPDLAARVLSDALFGEPVKAHLVHVETHFDLDEVHRHITILLVTPTRLVLGHIDDDTAEPDAGPAIAQATTEDIDLEHVRNVMIGYVFDNPERYQPGQAPRDVTVTIAWGAVSRLELRPDSCSDPTCDADHGYVGVSGSEDLALRVTADAEGQDAVDRTLAFGLTLRAAAQRARRA